MENKTVSFRLNAVEQKKYNALCEHYMRGKQDQFRYMLREAYEKMQKEIGQVKETDIAE